MTVLLKSLLFLSLLFVSHSAIPSLLDEIPDGSALLEELGTNKARDVDQAIVTEPKSVDFVTNDGGNEVNDAVAVESTDTTAAVDAEEAFADAAAANKHVAKGKAKHDFETKFLGHWEIHSPNSGVSSMQIQLLPTNKAIMYDASNLGPSNIQLKPGNCRPIPGRPGQEDCWAHAVEYDVETAAVRPLKIISNTWCSSGGLMVDGSLMSTGGADEGNQSVRILNTCPTCDFQDQMKALAGPRWYASQETLEDGTFIIFGGRREFSYEYIPNSLIFTQKRVLDLPWIFNHTDPYENSLYPFVHLLPDGTIFLLVNNKSAIIDTKTDTIVRELPVMPGGSRNYPASGMSALLPLKLSADGGAPVEAEVLVCGGAKAAATHAAEKKLGLWPALTDCGRIFPMKQDARWKMENMPTRRVMGDMLLLPTADVLIINGAMQGVSGWWLGESPNLTPLLYSPDKGHNHRFKNLTPTTIPRMYHSSSAVLADGTVLVAGSNSNDKYTTAGKYPTELRVEKFTPPYLNPALDEHRPTIVEDKSEKKLSYGEKFTVKIDLQEDAAAEDLKVTMLHPPFTTHGYSQNQRMLVMEPVSYVDGVITATAPASGKLAPPGYYILYVVHRGIPSRGMWVQINRA